MTVLDRFLGYVVIDSQSEEDAGKIPSTEKQFAMSDKLAAELAALGVKDVIRDEMGYVYGKLPSNLDREVPAVGFCSHIDTATELPGPSETPRVIKGYGGSVIALNDRISLDPATDKALAASVGCDLVVTNGETLLGGDDKAGVAEIMTAVQYFVEHPEVKHGTFCFAFTPDEEVGTSTDEFSVEKWGADVGYTVDGAGPNEIEFENFNAAWGHVAFHGMVTHPGGAKNVMKNANLMAMEFAGMLPAAERPEHTEGYEGFYHLISMGGTCDEAQLAYLLRDPDRESFEQRKVTMQAAADFIRAKYGEKAVDVTFKDSYYNMAEVVEQHPECLEHARAAIRAAGLTPVSNCIRGGTDGCRISFMGVPCPNLGTGSYNHHGNTEFANVQHMEKMVEIILGIVKEYAK
ncbi:MAG: peptidase T [Eubacterium sp.]|nr:peptidase T [Eubacterium sp.]